MSNENKELLEWAVKNIKEWNDKHTHLRSDSSSAPLFYTSGDGWHPGHYWKMWSETSGEYCILSFTSFSTTTPQVITKQEYMEAKAMKDNTFTKDMLKTGMIVVTTGGQTCMVLKDTELGDVLAGNTWCPLDSYGDDQLFGQHLSNRLSISCVYQPQANSHFIDRYHMGGLNLNGCDLVWYRKKKSEKQLQIEKIEAKIRELSKQQEELADRLNQMKEDS